MLARPPERSPHASFTRSPSPFSQSCLLWAICFLHTTDEFDRCYAMTDCLYSYACQDSKEAYFVALKRHGHVTFNEDELD